MTIVLHNSLVDIDVDALVVVEYELLLYLIIDSLDISVIVLVEWNLRDVLVWKLELNHVEISKAVYNFGKVLVFLLKHLRLVRELSDLLS